MSDDGRVERADGRAPDELRPLLIEPGFVRTATGSALMAAGSFGVLATGVAALQEYHRT